jgi:hypothetical protein
VLLVTELLNRALYYLTAPGLRVRAIGT